MARRRRGPGSESAGYHYDATPKRTTRTRTPVSATPKGMAAKGPAGDYKGADKDFAAAVAALPAPARKATEAATVAATKRQARAAGASRRRVNELARAEQRRQAAALASVRRRRQRRQTLRASTNPAKAIISSTPNPLAKPERFAGKPTAGAPTRQDLEAAKDSGTLKVNRKGFVTTPDIRKVSADLARLRSAARASNAPLPGLGPPESRNARTVLRRGERAGATREEKLAAIATGLVEAPNFKNPAGGHADSEGWRQERTSIYGTGPQGPRNVKASADRFFHEVRTDAGTSTAPTPGLLAQATQGSAFPERYDERLPEAKAILRAYNQGGLKPGQQRKLRTVQKAARQLGLKAGAKGPIGPPPKKVVTKYKAIRHWAGQLEKARIAYNYGGGHNGGMPDPSEGLDCSSSIVWVLRKAGVDIPNIVSGDFGNYLEPGPGAVTVFYNSGHVFMRIGDRYFGTSQSNPGSGPGFVEEGYSQDYLSQYNVAHVPGLGRKQAVQLGFTDLGAGGVATTTSAFPGMTLSSSGTTATIEEGASVKKGKAGFSKRPIRLTPLQRYNRNKRKLRELGVPLGGKKRSEPETHPVLQELIDKYGSASPVPTTAAERKAKALAAAAA
jgi:hypothetical protein